MRIAIASDIHGNVTAFEAVLADLRQTSPDLIFHGGDLADSGSSPAEIVDRIRDLGWPGVLGNTDQMLVWPSTLADFAKTSSKLQPLFAVIEEMAQATREALGPDRINWLSQLPMIQTLDELALVHASPGSPWCAAGPEMESAGLESVYGPLQKPLVVYAHIHRAFIRKLPAMTVANTGSVSLSYDGDPRAAYLLLKDAKPEIRRVPYDVDAEVQALSTSGLPHADWIANILNAAMFQMPPEQTAK
jgi:predicted phosphodiesterase